MADFQVITSEFVKLHISTSKSDVSFNERSFSKFITVSDLKVKLELITGGNSNSMLVDVYDKRSRYVCTLSNNEALLGSYPVDDGMRLHVVDNFSIRDELDVGDVKKFEISEEDYAKKADTVKAFLIKNKMGLYNEEIIKKKEKLLAEEQQLAENTPIGARCKVMVSNAPSRLGTVLYTGAVDTLPGYWIGIKFDEPLGKNDGTFKGKKYFECVEKYGAFVKPHNIECGDFSEEDYGLDDEI